MILRAFLIICCAAACYGNGYQSYYVPQPQIVEEYYTDEPDYHQIKAYDDGYQNQYKNLQDSRGYQNYGNGENHALRNLAKQAHYNQGAKEAAHSSGGQESHEKNFRDKGSYEREKKYGYEKAYGYERETKNHDVANSAHSQGSGYNHNANKQHYNNGGHSIKDLASQGHRHKYGSDGYDNKAVLIDLSDDDDREGDFTYPDIYGQLDRVYFMPHQPLRPYKWMLRNPSFTSDVEGALRRFRYLSGIHGLGGIRGYGLGYGYNPFRYGYVPMKYNGYLDSELK